MFGEFLQTHEGARNDMTLRTVDTLTLGPNTNLQGRIRHFILATRKALQRQWQDKKMHKTPVTEISRTNCMCKQQRSDKGLKFGDHQNLIYDAIRTGVIEVPPTCDSLHNVPISKSPANSM